MNIFVKILIVTYFYIVLCMLAGIIAIKYAKRKELEQWFNRTLREIDAEYQKTGLVEFELKVKFIDGICRIWRVMAKDVYISKGKLIFVDDHGKEFNKKWNAIDVIELVQIGAGKISIRTKE